MINAMNSNQMKVLSISLHSMKESNVDTKEYEEKRSNKMCTQNVDKYSKNASNKNPNNVKEKEENHSSEILKNEQ
jgi:hypothetical protein